MARQKKQKHINVMANRSHELIGLLLLVVALFILIALISFSLTEKLEDLPKETHEYSNWLGEGGAWLAAGLRWFAGWAAYCIPLIIGIAGWMTLRNENTQLMIVRVITLFLLIPVLAVFIAALFPGLNLSAGDQSESYDPTGYQPGIYRTGGILGGILSYHLSGFVGSVGTFFITFTLFIIALYLITRFSFNPIFEMCMQLLKKAVGAIGQNIQARKKRKPSLRREQENVQRTCGTFGISHEQSEQRSSGGLFGLFAHKQEITEKHSVIQKPPFIQKVIIYPDGNRDTAETNETQDAAPQLQENQKAVHNQESPLSAALHTTGSTSDAVAVEDSPELQDIHDLDTSKTVESDSPVSAVTPHNDYTLPPVTLLNESVPEPEGNIHERIKETADALEEALRQFSIESRVIDTVRGPVITRYELQLAPGVKITQILSRQDDIQMALAAERIRIIAPIPGKAAVGIEIPNKRKSLVTLGDIVRKASYKKSGLLEIGLGKNISGDAVMMDLSKAPHLLVAGATGTGKSVCINAMIVSILYKSRPDEVKFIMIDPKMVELKPYSGIPHLLTPVITDAKKATKAMRWVVREMEDRYRRLEEKGARSIDEYNAKCDSIPETEKSDDEKKEYMPMPRLVVIVDEFYDLMLVARADIELSIQRIAQMARAVGIHLILATQRPSVDVITGVIKANLPTRIAFQTITKLDSRTILDQNGSEKLLGNGDMLLMLSNKPTLIRVQGSFISGDEIKRVVDFCSAQAEPEYCEAVFEDRMDSGEGTGAGKREKDELYRRAVELVVTSKRGSASYIQRELQVGYNRAARMIEDMEMDAIVGPAQGSKARAVYVNSVDNLPWNSAQ